MVATLNNNNNRVTAKATVVSPNRVTTLPLLSRLTVASPSKATTLSPSLSPYTFSSHRRRVAEEAEQPAARAVPVCSPVAVLRISVSTACSESVSRIARLLNTH